MRKIIKNKRAISPIISTVLLIMIAIIIAIIILIWGRGFIKEKLLKFDKPVENVCSEVGIRAFINDDNSYGFTNTGNIPIYQVDLKKMERGKSTITRIDKGVNPGGVIILGNDYDDPDIEEIRVIPVLLGETDSGSQKDYSCPEHTSVIV
tara:strand:- start:155 stop:604 length:450 start_codon:yes stop_codon:yes gene_type:complete